MAVQVDSQGFCYRPAYTIIDGPAVRQNVISTICPICSFLVKVIPAAAPARPYVKGCQHFHEILVNGSSYLTQFLADARPKK